MLTTRHTTTILPVADADRARRFYAEALGLTEAGHAPDGMPLLRVGEGDMLGLQETESGAQSRHTVLSFEVPDIGAEIRELEGRGVHFEDYDLPNMKTIDHVWDIGTMKAAWFTDSEGNILCLHQDAT